ncbi:MAG TPA: hypothetical protein VF801_01665 [Rhodocyclaceae bacterium]
MSRKFWKPLAAIAAMAALAPAHAQMRRGMPAEPRGDFARSGLQQQADPPRDPPFHQDFQPGRMTPEERRQLRRDIHDAGRELYRGNPPPPRSR